MIRLCIVGVFSVLIAVFLVSGNDANAISSNIVISQVQLGDSASVKNEFVELYNNSSQDVEISNWCLYYVTTSLTASKMICFTPMDSASHLFLPSHAYLLAVSNELMTAVSPMFGDFSFSSTLSGVGGNVRLQDSAGAEIDKVSWGNQATDSNLVAASPNGSVLSRKNIDGVLVDSDKSSADFEIISPRLTYQFGLIYEVKDICSNLDGIQAGVPDGYLVDGDKCSLPASDVCLNIDGIQVAVPIGMRQVGGNCDILGLRISEILPNAVGGDSGSEFIELYNPTDVDVDLSQYILQIGPSFSHNYTFSAGAMISAGQYAVFYNDDIKFTLLNTAGSVRLVTSDGLLVFETKEYFDPPEGFAWAEIGGIWQYTNVLTPSNSNIIGTIKPESMEVGDIAPCAVGQERNPITGRCRKITNSVLVPCKDGQYRSEETNRCRSIISEVSSLAVCAEGQERNPKTNRCRSVATNADYSLEPCKEGQERNPETNRCRNVSKMISANYTPEKTVPVSSYFGWWALGGVGLVAIGYGVWEWRVEAGRLLKKIPSFIKRKK